MDPVPRGFVFHGVVFLSVFLDVRLHKRKIFHRILHFNACRVISALLQGGIFYLGFFFFPFGIPWTSGELCACVHCSGRLEPGIL